MKIYEKMNRSNTALLVIDIVNGCAHRKCEIPEWNIHFRRIRKMVLKLKVFIEDYRRVVKTPVVFINVTPWTERHLAKNINELYTDPRACYYSKDKTGFNQKFYFISPEKGDAVFTKNHYDAFANPEFRKYLKQNKISYLVVTGIFGDGCVMATICGGFSRGYNFVILKDLIETTDIPERQKLQKLLKNFTWPIMYGKTMNSMNFLGAWRNR